MAAARQSDEAGESAKGSRTKHSRIRRVSIISKRQALLIGSVLCALGTAASGLLAMENFFNDDHPSMAASYVLPALFLVFLFAGIRLFRMAGR